MAIVALKRGWNVGKIFTLRNSAVVTRGTTANYFHMVNRCCRCPRLTVMATLAHRRAVNMGWVLAFRDCAVVTTHATSQYLHMIDIGGW